MAAKSANWALVTGATGGLGRAFAQGLARRGYNLVLTARGKNALETLAASLVAAHGIEVATESCDLSVPGAGAALKAALDTRDIAVETLINNAGFGVHGRFTERTAEQELGMVDVNVRALTELTHVFAADMAARGGGHILLVASTAAFQPIPGYAVYAASKAYVLALGHGLNIELAHRKVVVSVTCPGPTETEFWSHAGHRLDRLARAIIMKPDTVAEAGLDALYAGRASIVTGWVNKLITFPGRFAPRSLQARVAAFFMRNRR
ncbi:SDR family oxidoreductase [Pseudomonas sp. R2.Fl]|nr:SDR family oxidoreductase [Pseudomonas sp. R2.Fl]